MELFRKKEEPTKVDGLTVSELKRLVKQTRGYRPSEAEIQIVLEEEGLPSPAPRGMASPGRCDAEMASPDGMNSPTFSSIDRPTSVSDSMTQEEFLVRFDASILMGGGGSGSN
jgi:hypothetical protein